MSSRPLIVGIGEAFLESSHAGDVAGGLAMRVPMLATRLACDGAAIARLGQDAAGARLIGLLRQAGARIDSLQSDPDLPTARLTTRSVAGQVFRSLDARAAFDNLQWDFDLEDVAQQTDAVIFGDLARRNGQARTTIDRFLTLCTNALRIYDLTNRSEGGLDRIMVARAAELADGLVLDPAALRALTPGSGGGPAFSNGSVEVERGAVEMLIKRLRARFIVLVDGPRAHAFSETGLSSSTVQIGAIDQDAVIVGVVHGVLQGLEWTGCLDAALRFGAFAHSQPGVLVPPDALRA